MKVEPPKDYFFSAKVQGELDRLRDWDGPDFRSKLAIQDPKHANFLSSEVLVLALRQGQKSDGDLVRQIANALLERWGKFILKAAWRRFPATKADWEAMEHSADILGPAGVANAWHATGQRADMLQEVYTRMWERIKNPGYQFWTVNFIFTLERLCFDVARSMGAKAEILAEMIVREHDEESPEYVDVALSAEDAVAARDVMGRALASLPAKQATAIYLRHIRGWRIAGTGGATGRTISDVLQVSDRMVRNYLRAGEKALITYYKESEL